MMKRCRNGFTLIEMLAVLAIIAIILSLAIPKFGNITRTMKLRSAADNLAGILESASQYAITNGQKCRVIFPLNTGNTDLDCRAYKMYDPEIAKTIGKWEFLPKGATIDKSYSKFITDSGSINFPEDNSDAKNVNYIEFDRSGKADTGSSGTIKIQDAKGISFICITYYNNSSRIRRWDIGEKAED